MKYDQIKYLSDEQFPRLTGVKHTTFMRMQEILKEADLKKKAKGGRKNTVASQIFRMVKFVTKIFIFANFGHNYPANA